MAKSTTPRFVNPFNVDTSEEAFVNGAGTGTVVAPIEAPKQAETKADEKPYSPFKNHHTARNNIQIELLKNDLTARKRNRKKHGTNLTVPLYIEELLVIQAAFDVDQSVDSVNDLIRQTILAKAEEILGERKYKKVIAEEWNKGRVYNPKTGEIK
ncbi:hypothetical protein E5H25_18090 [Acinetobacter baumannii]|uniref:hypothetical protein n=1 Tax=Acinetobacter baumannii TaxID=470 RepID=UPI0010A385B6|nr:hypothetical protein [Acinetobacter baumannii]MDO7242824.1 hypothetical protein [Acinetobacter baumannii]THD86662.1 hypothetical protein E5H25_18090 [Acinetobacter baumannii]HAV4576036.1 hypothetical protein [Acinetobacter baumannii]HDQ4387971.1 hypothetical protein [Acinetobacter baumannii]